MLDINTQLFVFFEDDTTFINHSVAAQDYSRDDFTIEMVSADDKKYIGYRKPINSVYYQITTPNTAANTLSWKYFNGTSFVTVGTFLDETKGFTRSGFVSWNRNLTSEAVTTIDGQEAFWYEITTNTNHTSTVFRGINTVFSDDNDLKTIIPSINSSKFYVGSEISHILAHVAARDDIIQYLRRAGRFKVDPDSGDFEDINVFDLLRINQMREASMWKALSIIFDDKSVETDDSFEMKARKYEGRYKKCRDVMYLNIDTNDDGLENTDEQLATHDVIVVRR